MASPVLAFDAEVKKADVIVIINNQSKMYGVGEVFVLQAGDIICFDKGAGRVAIKGKGGNKNYKKQLSKRSKSCKHLPSENGKETLYAKGVLKTVVSLFQKSKEKSVDGVSRNTGETDILTAPISINKLAKYLAIENSSWGPLPIVLEIIDDKGEVVEKMENEVDINTSFIIPTSLLKEGYGVRVFNSFEDELINSKIQFQQ